MIEEIKEIVLEIRQYLINTEFAPEPLGEPVEPNKLTKDFPAQIHQKYIDAGWVKLADNQDVPDKYRWWSYNHELLTPKEENGVKTVWKKIKVEENSAY